MGHYEKLLLKTVSQDTILNLYLMFLHLSVLCIHKGLDPL